MSWESKGVVTEYPAVWLAGAGCSGCSVSLLNAVSPNIRNVLVDPVLPGKHVNLRFHPVVMAGQGEPAIKVLVDTRKENPRGYLLLVEGAIPTAGNGLYCTIGELEGRHMTMQDTLAEMASEAMAVVCVGTCASFGGIPSAAPNPSACKSVSQVLDEKGIDTPLINVPGCPPHSDWMTGTVAMVLLNGIPGPDDLDAAKRPKAFYGTLIHDNCPRRAYFDAGQFARHTGEPGCLYEIGCKGPMTYADCPLRMWNDGVNWCVGAGAPCIGCVEPGFPDRLQPMYLKINDERMERFKIKTR